MTHKLCGQSPAARAEASPEPLAWFAGMIDHCYDYVEAAKAQGRPVVGIMCEFNICRPTCAR